MEKKAPECIHPASDARDADAEDETEDVVEIRFLDKSRDTDDDFDHPVDTGDQKKDDLDQSRKTIEPFHLQMLLTGILYNPPRKSKRSSKTKYKEFNHAGVKDHV